MCVLLCMCALQDVLNDAVVVGEALGLQQQAAAAVASLKQRMDAAKKLVAELPPVMHPVVSDYGQHIRKHTGLRIGLFTSHTNSVHTSLVCCCEQLQNACRIQGSSVTALRDTEAPCDMSSGGLPWGHPVCEQHRLVLHVCCGPLCCR
jgi:hypothetical protein